MEDVSIHNSVILTFCIWKPICNQFVTLSTTELVLLLILVTISCVEWVLKNLQLEFLFLYFSILKYWSWHFFLLWLGYAPFFLFLFFFSLYQCGMTWISRLFFRVESLFQFLPILLKLTEWNIKLHRTCKQKPM